MSVYLDDVAYWVHEWRTNGEPISDSVAHKIAEYWQISPHYPGDEADTEAWFDVLANVRQYAKNAGHLDGLDELDALKAWATPDRGTRRGEGLV